MDFTGNKIYKCGDSLSKIYKCGEVVWSANTTPDYSAMPLTFETTTIGTKIVFNFPQDFTIQYSRDGNHWNTITDTRVEFALWSTKPDGTYYTVPLMIKADNPTYCLSYPSVTTLSASTGPFIVYGNMMSLINSTNYSSLTSLTAKSAFRCFFKDCTGLTSAENLILPTISLSDNCYSELFRNCTSLTIPPVLPATTLAPYCYRSLFNGCTSLQTAPALPATTLAIYCYTWMFKDCPFSKAPELLATEKVSGAYSNMFYNCTNLNWVKCMLLGEYMTAGSDWLKNVSPTGTFVKNPNSTWESGVRGVPEGWTIVDSE